MTMKPITSWLALASLLAAAANAGAGTFLDRDHFRCYKAKDSIAKASYVATLTPNPSSGLAVETGCTIRVPAVLLCDPVAKQNLQPPPSVGLKTEQLFNQLLCYKLKCASTSQTVQFTDQFGARGVTVKKPNMICAPIPVSPT